MLDSATKHRIDNARDVLVGKVPDPKAQVEQITTALIYKFMDDMDQEAVGMGGQASFFTGAYEKYAWPKVMAKTLSGYERLGLYSEAITEMNQNPHLPQLFRDVFKDAFLPYKDPETLNLFLKEIDGFKYDHSERLGDAFEYLLSVLGSQGAAGQFRTPRHIIDFIVEAVDPGKTDSVLDPACGTAGFLISAYKQILAKHQEKKLSPDEMAQLTKNFVGYDIAPEMVRLSQVNMYLHKFPNPTVFEYDTLTSEERWDDSFDVILANPPFMTPKGGIRPHTRFSVRANRSEVLFVDYIAEHLNPEGRAGVIVPEGIIFQSNNAYKALRKMLVEENYLYAVVSLPAGVFNPYSGVKTSILLMDKKLAKQTDNILFVNIENDGFNLGAQRGDIEGSDLPETLQIIKNFQSGLYEKSVDIKSSIVIAKEKIAKNDEYSFSGARYRTNEIYNNLGCPTVKLGDACEILDNQRIPIKKTDRINGDIPYYGATGILDYVNDYIFNEDLVLIGEDGAKWKPGEKTAYAIHGKSWVNNHAHVIRPNRKKLLDVFLIEIINSMDLSPYVTGVTVPKLNQKNLRDISIPIPPLDVQREMVEEIEGYQKVIDGARQVVENYKPRIKVDPGWPMVELGEIVKINNKSISPAEKYGEKEFIYIDISSVGNGTGTISFEKKIKGNDAPSRARRSIKFNDVLLSTVRPNLKAFAILKNIPKNAVASTGFAVLTTTDAVIPGYIYYQLFSEYLQNQMIARMGRGSYPSINQKDVSELRIPLPPIETQKTIVEQIESEQKIIDANKELINIFEKKIEEKIGEVWGEG